MEVDTALGLLVTPGKWRLTKFVLIFLNFPELQRFWVLAYDEYHLHWFVWL
jgi:hypothetical protein